MEVDKFMQSDRPKKSLENPLAAEFGIYSKADLDDFITRHLPTFKLVRLLFSEAQFFGCSSHSSLGKNVRR